MRIFRFVRPRENENPSRWFSMSSINREDRWTTIGFVSRTRDIIFKKVTESIGGIFLTCRFGEKKFGKNNCCQTIGGTRGTPVLTVKEFMSSFTFP